MPLFSLSLSALLVAPTLGLRVSALRASAPLRRAVPLLCDAPDAATVSAPDAATLKAELAQLQVTLEAKKAEGGSGIVYSPQDNVELIEEIQEITTQIAAKEEALRVLQFGTTVRRCARPCGGRKMRP